MMWTLLLSLSWAQDPATPPVEVPAFEGTQLTPDQPDAPVPEGGPDGELPPPEPEPEPEPEPRPWTAPDDRSGQLGPWPDGHQASDTLGGLPVIDPLSGRVLDEGAPLESGWHGPSAPAVSAPRIAPEPEPADPIQESALPVADAPEPETALTPAPEPPVDDGAHSHAWTERLLPQLPPPSGKRGVLWLIFAGLAAVGARRVERMVPRLPKRGVLPTATRGLVLALRLVALVGVLVGGARSIPLALWPLPAVLLFAAAVGAGWQLRDLLQDLLAGVVLAVEHRLIADQRVTVGAHSGRVIGLGFRSVLIEGDDGLKVTVPNRTFLRQHVQGDPDPYAPVELHVHGPAGMGAQDTRELLEEIALTSPYLAPGRAPEVARDPDPAATDVWVLRARLVHPRHALAFKGSMIELLDERGARAASDGASEISDAPLA
jgi:hypothetical protein